MACSAICWPGTSLADTKLARRPALDACENLLHLSFIAYGAHPMPGAYLLAGVVASSKWLLIATFVIGLIVVQHGLLRSTGKSGQN